IIAMNAEKRHLDCSIEIVVRRSKWFRQNLFVSGFVQRFAPVKAVPIFEWYVLELVRACGIGIFHLIEQVIYDCLRDQHAPQDWSGSWVKARKYICNYVEELLDAPVCMPRILKFCERDKPWGSALIDNLHRVQRSLEPSSRNTLPLVLLGTGCSQLPPRLLVGIVVLRRRAF